MFTTETPRLQGKQKEHFGLAGSKTQSDLVFNQKDFGRPWGLGVLVVKPFRFFLVSVLVFSLILTPRLVQAAFAQEDAAAPESASAEDFKTIQILAKNGYLGDKKDFYLSAKTITDDQVVDALMKANETLAQLDLKTVKPGKGNFRVEDLKALLAMVKERSEDIVARKGSAWTFRRKIERVIAVLAPEREKPAEEAPKVAEKAEAAPAPLPTATPIPGPNREEWNGMKDDLKGLSKMVGELKDVLDKKIDGLQKSNDEIKLVNGEIKASNRENSTAVAENQEQLRLVKRLMEKVQEDLKKTDDHLELVEKKAGEKTITDTELQQELNIMHKDLRDNSQDVSILKQQVAKLDKSGEKAGESPLDSALGSKWLAGGALLVGLTALILTITKK